MNEQPVKVTRNGPEGQRIGSRTGQVYVVHADGSLRREGPARVRRRKRERVALMRFARLFAKAKAEGRLGELEAGTYGQGGPAF